MPNQVETGYTPIPADRVRAGLWLILFVALSWLPIVLAVLVARALS